MYSLMLLLGICIGCHQQDNTNLSLKVNKPVVAQKYCKCENCKCEECHCNDYCCPKVTRKVNVELDKNTTKTTVHISEVSFHIVPTESELAIFVDTNKTLPIDVAYKKIKTGGYEVSLIVQEK